MSFDPSKANMDGKKKDLLLPKLKVTSLNFFDDYDQMLLEEVKLRNDLLTVEKQLIDAQKIMDKLNAQKNDLANQIQFLSNERKKQIESRVSVISDTEAISCSKNTATEKDMNLNVIDPQNVIRTKENENFLQNNSTPPMVASHVINNLKEVSEKPKAQENDEQITALLKNDNKQPSTTNPKLNNEIENEVPFLNDNLREANVAESQLNTIQVNSPVVNKSFQNQGLEKEMIEKMTIDEPSQNSKGQTLKVFKKHPINFKKSDASQSFLQIDLTDEPNSVTTTVSKTNSTNKYTLDLNPLLNKKASNSVKKSSNKEPPVITEIAIPCNDMEELKTQSQEVSTPTTSSTNPVEIVYLSLPAAPPVTVVSLPNTENESGIEADKSENSPSGSTNDVISQANYFRFRNFNANTKTYGAKDLQIARISNSQILGVRHSTPVTTKGSQNNTNLDEKRNGTNITKSVAILRNHGSKTSEVCGTEINKPSSSIEATNKTLEIASEKLQLNGSPKEVTFAKNLIQLEPSKPIEISSLNAITFSRASNMLQQSLMTKKTPTKMITNESEPNMKESSEQQNSSQVTQLKSILKTPTKPKTIQNDSISEDSIVTQTKTASDNFLMAIEANKEGSIDVSQTQSHEIRQQMFVPFSVSNSNLMITLPDGAKKVLNIVNRKNLEKTTVDFSAAGSKITPVSKSTLQSATISKNSAETPNKTTNLNSSNITPKSSQIHKAAKSSQSSTPLSQKKKTFDKNKQPEDLNANKQKVGTPTQSDNSCAQKNKNTVSTTKSLNDSSKSTEKTSSTSNVINKIIPTTITIELADKTLFLKDINLIKNDLNKRKLDNEPLEAPKRMKISDPSASKSNSNRLENELLNKDLIAESVKGSVTPVTEMEVDKNESMKAKMTCSLDNETNPEKNANLVLNNSVNEKNDKSQTEEKSIESNQLVQQSKKKSAASVKNKAENANLLNSSKSESTEKKDKKSSKQLDGNKKINDPTSSKKLTTENCSKNAQNEIVKCLENNEKAIQNSEDQTKSVTLNTAAIKSSPSKSLSASPTKGNLSPVERKIQIKIRQTLCTSQSSFSRDDSLFPLIELNSSDDEQPHDTKQKKTFDKNLKEKQFEREFQILCQERPNKFPFAIKRIQLQKIPQAPLFKKRPFFFTNLVLHKDSLYTVTGNGQVKRMNLTDINEVISFPPSDKTIVSLHVCEKKGFLFITCADGVLRILHKESGEELKTIKFNSQIRCSCSHGLSLYLGLANGSVVCVEMDSLAIESAKLSDEPITRLVHLSADKLLFCSLTEAIIWDWSKQFPVKKLPKEVKAPILAEVYRDRIYTMYRVSQKNSSSSLLKVYDARSLELISESKSNNTFLAMLFTRDKVILVTFSQLIQCFDLKSMKLLFNTYYLPSVITCVSLLDTSTLLVGDQNGCVDTVKLQMNERTLICKCCKTPYLRPEDVSFHLKNVTK